MGFVARHAMVTKVRGSFTDFTGSVSADEGVADAAISVDIQAASLDTRNVDGHLLSGDFFDVQHHPRLTFASTSVYPLDDETLRVTGVLTIKSTTRAVTLDFAYAGQATDPFGMQRVGFEGSTTILRSDFGMTFNAALETGGAS